MGSILSVVGPCALVVGISVRVEKIDAKSVSVINNVRQLPLLMNRCVSLFKCFSPKRRKRIIQSVF